MSLITLFVQSHCTCRCSQKEKETSHSKKNSCLARYRRELKCHLLTLPTLLLALYNVPVIMCLIFLQSILYTMVSIMDESMCVSTSEVSEYGLVVATVLQYLFLYLAYPLTGWLADTKLGRGRVVLLSLWFCWTGMLLQVASFCIQYGTCGWSVLFAKYGLSAVALVLMTLGTAGYLANALPYGIELLVFESNVKVRSFIHWTVWSIFLGSSYNFGALLAEKTLMHPNLVMLATLSSFGLLSAAVALNMILADRFPNNITTRRNPYSEVFCVLAYAVKHKVPQRRSAFTYSEHHKANRIDFAERKYGGPYSHETVDDVKTFLRILFVLFMLFGFFVAYPAVRDFMPTVLNQFRYGATDLNGFGSYLMWQVLDVLPAFILIPLLELFLLPIFPNLEYFFIKSLGGMLVNHILLVLSVLSLFVISTVGYLSSTEAVPCYFSWVVGDPTAPISYHVLIITVAIAGFADNFIFLYVFEFICSQSPTDMNGMLIGLFWCLRGTFIEIYYFMTLPFAFTSIGGRLSCGFWLSLIPLVFGAVGLFCFIGTIKWYTRRERDDSETINYQLYMEEQFAASLQRMPQN